MKDSKHRIIAYSHRSDETGYFQAFAEKYQVEVVLREEKPTLDTAHLAEGFPCVSIITTPVDSALVGALNDRGVRFISTRTIGYDHIDLEAASSSGLRVGNASYSPATVAEYAVMLMMMSVRRIKAILRKSDAQDYSLSGAQGRELGKLTVGVAGTGRIGATVIRILQGFGCRVLAYDPFPNEAIRPLAQYVSWEELLERSDVISLHIPATEANTHIVSATAFARMKKGAILINTARGSLVDTAALIEAIEAGKLGGAALDVIEEEHGLYYNDLRGVPLPNRDLALLRSFPNVLVTPHTAFYTDQAVSDMVENSIRSCVAFMRGEQNPWEVALRN